MKKELTLEDFSIRNGEEYQEYQEFLGLGRRKKGGGGFPFGIKPPPFLPKPFTPPPPPPPLPSVAFKPPTKNDIKMEAVCRSPLMKRTRKCRDYFEQKLRKEQEAARLAAEAAAKEAAQQQTLIKTITTAVTQATTEAQAKQARQNLELVRELADLRANQATIAKQRADQLGLLQQELKQTSGTSGGEISNSQADLINKILNESTLDKMKQAVAESPLLTKLPNKVQAEMTTTTQAQPVESESETIVEQTTTGAEAPAGAAPAGAAAPAPAGAAPAPAADKKNNMLLYGAIGVGVLLLLFGKKIFGGTAAAAAPTA